MEQKLKRKTGVGTTPLIRRARQRQALSEMSRALGDRTSRETVRPGSLRRESITNPLQDVARGAAATSEQTTHVVQPRLLENPDWLDQPKERVDLAPLIVPAVILTVAAARAAAPLVKTAIAKVASQGFGVKKLTHLLSRENTGVGAPGEPRSPQAPAGSANNDASSEVSTRADWKIRLDIGALACLRVSAQVSGLDLWDIYDAGRKEADAYLRDTLTRAIGPAFATSVYTMKADHNGLLVVALIRLSAENAVGVRHDMPPPSPKPAQGASQNNKRGAVPILDMSEVPSAVTKFMGTLLKHNRPQREPAMECSVGVIPDVNSQAFLAISGLCEQGFDPALALPSVLEFRQTNQQNTIRVIWKTLSWRVDGDDQASAAPASVSEQVNRPG